MCTIGIATGVCEGRSVVAWKVFRKGRGRTLRPQLRTKPKLSYSRGKVYQAVDYADDPTAPDLLNRFGFYAFATQSAATAERNSYAKLYTVRRVKLFGTIVRHQAGYRGEFMFIG